MKLALFGANCSSGRTYATIPERWDASWENNLRLARLADEIGLDALVPIARWKGYGGESCRASSALVYVDRRRRGFSFGLIWPGVPLVYVYARRLSCT